MKIDISICPTCATDTDGNELDTDAYLARIRAVVAEHWPDATIAIQMGYRQGDEWYHINGSPSGQLREYITEHVDWSDEDLWYTN